MISEPNSLYFTVTKDDMFAGLITISKHDDEQIHELSYQFIPRYWGKGYALESIQAVLSYVKKECNVASLIAETQSANEKSISLLLKLDMVFEKEVIRFSEKQSIYRLNI